jgi:glycine cleavage system H protein
MANVPANLKYTEQHEWLSLEGDVATMGITDYAQGALGDVVFIELPAVGRKVKQGESFVVVESVNSTLSSAPETINQHPYEAGWICKIKISDAAETAKLLESVNYEKLVA